jgi:competence protein ComEC
VLVYDTGPALGANLDAGRAVVSPFLKSQGRHHIDMLVVSHDDIDHAGGAKTMVEQHSVNTLIAWPDTVKRIGMPVIERVNETDDCREYRSWQWDGIHFALFSWMSFGGNANRDNNYSCILKVSGRDFSILLPGDIEKRAEYSLINRIGNYQKHQCLGFDLRADVLVAPHHGSKSSSSSMFIRAVQPDQVIFASAYRSRFGHPHEEIVKRYEDNKVLYWNTAFSGALSYRISSELKGLSKRDRLLPDQYRVSKRRFWQQSEQSDKIL